MNWRLFSRTKKKLNVAKILLATFTLFALFFGKTLVAFADPLDPNTWDYSNYRNLFSTYKEQDPLPVTINSDIHKDQGRLWYNGVLDSQKKSDGSGITGFILGMGLTFPGLPTNPTEDQLDDKWSYVAKQGEGEGKGVSTLTSGASGENGTFLIHAYEINTDGSIKRDLAISDQIYAQYSPANVTPDANNAHGLYKLNNQSVDGKPNYIPNQYAQTYFNIPNATIAYGSTVAADLWYCGGDGGGDDIPAGSFTSSNIPASMKDLQGKAFTFFPGYCGDTAYWKIGPTITFTLPVSAQDTTGTITPTQFNQASHDLGGTDTLPTCSVIGDIGGCVARLIYYAVFKPLAWLAGLFGKLFDFFIGYSISDQSYRLGFAVRGWELVRDICNIFFIIILVWTGFAAVFGIGKTSMKQIVPALIINAILINFSLFATRLVIDLSNVTARVFYSRIYVCDGACRDDNGDGAYDNLKNKNSIGGYWPLSEKIVSVFDPQIILAPSTLSNLTLENSDVTGGTAACNDDSANYSSQLTGDCISAQAQSTTPSAGYFIIVTLIGALIMFFILKMFWGVTFMFLGRVIGLYIHMIFAPFAFVSRKIPMLQKSIGDLSFDKWWGELSKLAILAPLFIFYLYILYSFLSSDLISQIVPELSARQGLTFIDKILSIAIPMLIIYFLIDQGAKLAKSYAGDIGNKIQGFVDKTVGGAGGVIGAGVGLAAGGAALVGTRYGSRLGKALGESSLGKWAASNAENSKLARGINNTLSQTQTGSWDFRKSKIYSGINKATSAGGVKLQDKLTPAVANLTKPVAGNLLDFSEKRFEGGYKGQQERRQKEIKENLENRVKYDHLNDAQATRLWERRQNKKAEERALHEFAKDDAEYNTRAERIKTMEAEVKKEAKALEDLRKELETKKDVLSPEDKKLKEEEIKTKTIKIENTNKNIATEKKVQDQKINSLKGTDYKNNDAYKDKLKKELDEQKKGDSKTYGKIESAKDFTNAMRRDYAEDLRNNSFWMKDGKQKKGLWGIGAGYGSGGSVLATGIGSILGGSVDAFTTAILSERIKFEQEALDAATQKYIKDYGKNKGKASKSEQLKAKIKTIDDTINKNLKEKAGKSDEEIEKMTIDDKRAELEAHIKKLQMDFEVASAKADGAKDKFKRDPDNATLEAEFRSAANEKKRAQDAYDELRNAWENRDKFNDQLEKEEEKGDKGGAKKDEKKDEKKDDKAK